MKNQPPFAEGRCPHCNSSAPVIGMLYEVCGGAPWGKSYRGWGTFFVFSWDYFFRFGAIERAKVEAEGEHLVFACTNCMETVW